jgi:CheY-like chemotaxis protein
MHCGSLKAHSRGPGRGSRFTITLPSVSFQQSQQSLPATDTSRPSSEALAAPLDDPFVSGRRLLIVEDNTDASTLLQELFETEGFAVDVATNGLEALQAANDVRHDVIVCDIGLPGMDGYEIAQRLRRDATTRHARLIALTGWGSNADQELATQSGFDLHLTKPIGFRELLHHVQEQLSDGDKLDQETTVGAGEPKPQDQTSACTAM